MNFTAMICLDFDNENNINFRNKKNTYLDTKEHILFLEF